MKKCKECMKIKDLNEFYNEKKSMDGHGNAHHILNYAEHKELRLNVDNGITFCVDCHKIFHKRFGYKNNNKEQINEFLHC